MGWTYYKASFYKPDGKTIDRKTELDRIFTGTTEHYSSRIIKSAMVGTTYYGAQEIIRKGEEAKVFAIVALTRVDNKSDYNFGYKDMDESEGPFYYDCPKGILDCLTETDDSNALKWREECRKTRGQKNSLSKLPIGTIIEYDYNGEPMRLQKMSPAYQFKRPWWKIVGKLAFINQNLIPYNFTLIS